MEKREKWQKQWIMALENINETLTEHRFAAIRELRQEFLIVMEQILVDEELDDATEITILLGSYTEAINIVAHAYLNASEIGAW